MQRKQNVQNERFECKFHKVKYEVQCHGILCLKIAVQLGFHKKCTGKSSVWL